MFPKSLDKFGRILTGRWFVLSFLEFFSYANAISANFRFFRKFDRSIELLTKSERKGASISKFSLIILVGKLNFWVALLVSGFCNSFLISLMRF